MTEDRLFENDYSDTVEAKRLQAEEKRFEDSMPDIDAIRAEALTRPVVIEGDEKTAVNLKAKRVSIIHSHDGRVITFNNSEELDIQRTTDGLRAKAASTSAKEKEEARSRLEFEEDE